jgi:large subunit ribosomal protein L9
MLEQTSIPADKTPRHLRFETEQATLPQNGASRRSVRFLWTAFGFAVLMLIGVSAWAVPASASHSFAEPPSLVPSAAFNPALPMLKPGGVWSVKQQHPISVPRMMAKKNVKNPKLQKILLQEDVDGLGKKGTLVEVKAAYAVNVLVPKGLGAVASKEMVEQIAKDKADAIAAFAAAKQDANQVKADLQKRYAKSGLVFEVQVSNDGTFPAVSTKEVAAEITREISRSTGDPGLTVHAEDVKMEDITELGSSEVATLTLHPEVDMSVKVEVVKSKITFS